MDKITALEYEIMLSGLSKEEREIFLDLGFLVLQWAGRGDITFNTTLSQRIVALVAKTLKIFEDTPLPKEPLARLMLAYREQIVRSIDECSTNNDVVRYVNVVH